MNNRYKEANGTKTKFVTNGQHTRVGIGAKGGAAKFEQSGNSNNPISFKRGLFAPRTVNNGGIFLKQ